MIKTIKHKCDSLVPPDFDGEQIKICKTCPWASAQIKWCGHFGIKIRRKAKFTLDLTRPPHKRQVQIPKQKPTLPQMAKDFSAAIIKWGNRGFKTISEDEYCHRRKICSECHGGWRCPYCGCALRFKIALIDEKCPIDKW